jgi:phosphatidylglycerol lysyltransferase
MEGLLLKYGYALLFLGVAVEGEAFLVAAALLVHRGYFLLPIVVAVAVAGNTVADLLYYFAARARGKEWLEGRFGGNPNYRRVVAAMERHGRWLLLGSRFALGFRILIPAACGALGMSPGVFLPLVVLAGVLWAIPTALVAYYAGSVIESALIDLRHYEVLIASAVVLVPAGYVGARRLSRLVRQRDLRATDLHALVPFVVGLMGVLNLLSAIVPRPPETIVVLERWLPLEVMQRSRPLMLFAGLALLQVTRSLARRKNLAWWVAAFALSISLLSHLGRAFDLHHSLVAALLLAYLVIFRRRFYARSDPASLQRALLMAPVIGVAVMIYGYVGLSNLNDQFSWDLGATPLSEAFNSGIAILDAHADPVTRHAARFLGSLQIAGWLARLYLLALLLRAVVLRDRLEAPPADVERLFRAHGQHSLGAFAIQPDKHHLLLADGRGLVAYAVRRSVALACGDPLASTDGLEECARGFVAHCRRNGWTPCVYEAAEVNLPAYQRLGMRSLKIAEEALIDLPTFSLAGGKRAALRALTHKVTRAGLTVRPYRRDLEASDAVDEQLEEISEEWLADKRLREMGFTLGRFSLEGLDGVRVFVCHSAERVEAFCTWLLYRDDQAAVVDLMRKRRDAVSGTMDLLLAESLLALKAEGLREASLANAPLANVGTPRRPLDRGVALLFENLNRFYGYKNLFQFKKKFAPRWEGRYLVYPRGSDLPRIAVAMTLVHGSGGLWHFLVKR